MNYPKCHFCGRQVHHIDAVVELTYQNEYGLQQEAAGIVRNYLLSCKSCAAKIKVGGCFNAPDGQEVSNQ